MIPGVAAALVWSLLAGPLAGVHEDGALLRAAARWHRVPAPVMLGVAAVESGYSGRNDWRGVDGEFGRMQIQLATARAAHCPRDIDLHDKGQNVACGARILHWCYEREQSWARAIRCYNGAAVPDGTTVYLEKVEREMGRQLLFTLDHPAPFPIGRPLR